MWAVRVNLPSGLQGDFAWQGTRYPLHTGLQTLTLSP